MSQGPTSGGWTLVTRSVSGSLPTSSCLILVATPPPPPPRGKHGCDAHCTDKEGRPREAELLPNNNSRAGLPSTPEAKLNLPLPLPGEGARTQ